MLIDVLDCQEPARECQDGWDCYGVSRSNNEMVSPAVKKTVINFILQIFLGK